MSFFKAFGLAVLGVLLFLSIAFFGLVFTIDQTFLNPDFTVSQVEKLDTASLAKDIIRGQIMSQAVIPINLPIEEFVDKAIDKTITEMEPWLKQQTNQIIYSFYDYLEGRSQRFSFVIPLETARESLINNLSGVVLASPPPGLTDQPPATIERYLEPFYERIPSSFEINEGWVGPQNMAYIEQLRQIISHFDIVYYALLGFILLLILAITLVKHDVRGSTRSLGATFFSCGIVSYGGVWLANRVIETQSLNPLVPVYLQGWLPQFMAEVFSPMELYSLVLAGVGLALLIVSFVYRRQVESELVKQFEAG